MAALRPIPFNLSRLLVTLLICVYYQGLSGPVDSSFDTFLLCHNAYHPNPEILAAAQSRTVRLVQVYNHEEWSRRERTYIRMDGGSC
jgi:hypothetical protein